MTALRNADAAGDTEAATRIAAMIRSQGSEQPQAEIAPIQQQYAPDEYPIPGEVEMSQAEKQQMFPQFGAGENIAALPETAASLATGATTGAAGYGAGSAVGAIGDLVGLLTPDEAQDLANRWSSNLTYQPDDPASQKQLEAIGETLGVLPAVMGSAPMSGALSRARGASRGSSVTPEAIASQKEFTRKGFTPRGLKAPDDATKQQQLTKALTSGDQGKVAAMADIDPDIVAARGELGLNEPGLPSAQSKNLQFRETEQALKKMPGSNLSKIENDAIVELQQKADNLITEYGGRSDKSSLSMDLAERSKKSIDELGDLASKAYDDIAQSIPRATKASMQKTGDLLKSELADLGNDLDQMSPLEKRLIKMSDSDNVTYAAVDKIRKEVGATIGKQSDKFKSEDTAALKRIYSALSEDQEATAKALGMSEQWDGAKSLVRQRKVLEDNAVNMFGKNLSDAFMPKIGQAMKNMTKGDYKKFNELINSVPESQRQEVVVSALNDVFTTGSRKEKQLSIAGFSDWFNGLEQNKAAKNTIYKNLPKPLTKQLDALGKVSNGIRDAQAAAPVGGQIMASQGVFDKVVNGFSRRVLSRLPGMIGDLVEVGLDKSKSKGIDAATDLLSDPDFVRGMQALAKGETKKAEAIERRLMRSKKMKDFSSTLTSNEASALQGLGLMGWLASDEASGDDE